jgi:hypothetical protein
MCSGWHGVISAAVYHPLLPSDREDQFLASAMKEIQDLHARWGTEMNRMQLLLFGVHNRTL